MVITRSFRRFSAAVFSPHIKESRAPRRELLYTLCMTPTVGINTSQLQRLLSLHCSNKKSEMESRFICLISLLQRHFILFSQVCLYTSSGTVLQYCERNNEWIQEASWQPCLPRLHVSCLIKMSSMTLIVTLKFSQVFFLSHLFGQMDWGHQVTYDSTSSRLKHMVIQTYILLTKTMFAE